MTNRLMDQFGGGKLLIKTVTMQQHNYGIYKK